MSRENNGYHMTSHDGWVCDGYVASASSVLPAVGSLKNEIFSVLLIHLRLRLVFCDCHRDSRAECLEIMYCSDGCGFTESSLLWPERGPYRGSGARAGAVDSMSNYSDDIG